MKNERSIPFSQSWCSLVATDVCRNPAPKKRFLDEYESSLCYRKSAKEIIQKGLFLDIVNVQAQKRVEAVKVAAVVYFLMFGNQTPAYTKLLSLFGREYARMTEAKQRAKEEKEYIKSLPRSERKAAKAALKQKHKEEDEAKKQREAEQEAMIQAAVQRRLDKAERVKQSQARAKLEKENAAKENENISSESIVQQTTDESTSDVQSVDTLQHSETETVRAEEKAPAIDTTVQDDSEEIEVELLDIEDKPVEQKQPVKSAVSPISQYVGLDEEIEVDIDDLDDIPLTPTERYQVTHLGARKITRKGKARPKLNTNTSLNDISIFDSAR